MQSPVEGVVAVWTYDDLAGAMAEPLPLLIPHPTLTHGRTQYALAKDEVNYVGEAIAFVVAVDRYVAEDAVSRIRVDYDHLEPVVGIAAARALPCTAGAPTVAMATAHPAKFPDAVERATGIRPPLPAALADLYEREERFTVAPNRLEEIEALVRAAVQRNADRPTEAARA